MTKHNVRRFMGAGFIGLAAFALAACGGKPSQDDLKDAMMEGADSVAAAGIDEATYEEFVDCAVESMYDNMSDEGLETIAEADESDLGSDLSVDGLSAEDQEAFSAAFTECTSVMMPEGATSGS
jgi:hypothetical protein